MEILKTIITACGGAAVAGIFSLILANRKSKSEIVKRLDALDALLAESLVTRDEYDAKRREILGVEP